jgi:predicted transcriptional regulator
VDASKPQVSGTELEVLKVLWEHGPGTVRIINAILREQGRRWAYNTVLTLLQRLEAKGCVSSDKRGLAHVFRAALSRDKLLRRRLKDLANQLCEGAASPLVRALVEGQRFSEEELGALREMLDRLEGKRP